MIRLNKYLANAGVVSRRKVGDLVRKGQVLINGVVASEPGQRVDPEVDQVSVDGKVLPKSSHLVYIALNKPLDVVSTTSDEHGRTAVTDLVESVVKLYPVGRLDSDSIGLILLTNDGELTHKLTHPKYHIDKRYQVMVRGKVTDDQINQLCQGVTLKDGLTAPAEVKVIEEYAHTSKLEFIIHEGKNRQIRRMLAFFNIEVLELKRLAIGEVELGALSPGEYRNLTEDEVNLLKYRSYD